MEPGNGVGIKAVQASNRCALPALVRQLELPHASAFLRARPDLDLAPPSKKFILSTSNVRVEGAR